MCLISIVIPAKNEAKRIGPTLDSYLAYYEEHYGSNFEILVVMNGCTDNTLEVVQQRAFAHESLHYLYYEEPIGKGGGLVKGLENARGEFVSFTDADMSTRPEVLDRLLKVIQVLPDVECVIGSRELNNSKVEGKSSRRRIMSWGFNFGVNLLFGLGIKDTQCGAKVIRKTIIPDIIPLLNVTNMAFDVNLLVDIKRMNGDILEIPIEWEDSDGSTINNPIKTSVRMAVSVVWLRLYYSPFKPVLQPFVNAVWRATQPKAKKLSTKTSTPIADTYRVGVDN